MGDLVVERLVFVVNGRRYELAAGDVDPSTTLLEFIRTRTPFKGTKLGCGEGWTGATNIGPISLSPKALLAKSVSPPSAQAASPPLAKVTSPPLAQVASPPPTKTASPPPATQASQSLARATSAPAAHENEEDEESLAQWGQKYIKSLSDRFFQEQAARGYEKGEPFLADFELKTLPWEMQLFYQWYMLASNIQKLGMITAVVPTDVYQSDEAILIINFEDMYAMFHQQKLDINLISLWCLMQYDTATKVDHKVGFLDPQRIAKRMFVLDNNPKNKYVKKNEKEKSKKQLKEELKQMNIEAKARLTDYIKHAMTAYQDKGYILAPYHFNDHYICLIMLPKDNRLCVFDSADVPEASYQEFTDIIQDAFQQYMSEGGINNPLYDKMRVRTRFQCYKQGWNTVHCGYYVCEYLKIHKGYDPYPEDKRRIDRLNFASGQMDDKKFKQIQADFCRFIMRNVIHPKGRFFNHEGELAKHPNLCDWTKLGIMPPHSVEL